MKHLKHAFLTVQAACTGSESPRGKGNLSHAPGSLNPQSVPFVTRSDGTISVEPDLMIVSTLCAHRYTQVATRIWSEHYFGRRSGPGGVPFVRESWYIRQRS
ncbi:hypothetical protein, partial [Pseudomonas viridiflava]